MSVHIQFDRGQITEFCSRHYISKFAFFGSVLRDDFRPESDVDVLIEFEPDHIPGLIELMKMQLEFSDMVGRDADFRAPGDLHHSFRDQVVAEAEVLYGA